MLFCKSKFQESFCQGRDEFELFELYSSSLSTCARITEEFKINPGAVEAIAEQPGHPENILIGYNRGLMVLWNRSTSSAEQVVLL